MRRNQGFEVYLHTPILFESQTVQWICVEALSGVFSTLYDAYLTRNQKEFRGGRLNTQIVVLDDNL